VDAPVIDLHGHPATLRKPRASTALVLASRGYDLSDDADVVTWTVLGAAALRECWPDDLGWPAPMRPLRWTLGKPIASYAQDVFDALAEVVPRSKLYAACSVAMSWARSHAIAETEVSEAEGFSGPPQGA